MMILLFFCRGLIFASKAYAFDHYFTSITELPEESKEKNDKNPQYNRNYR